MYTPTHTPKYHVQKQNNKFVVLANLPRKASKISKQQIHCFGNLMPGRMPILNNKFVVLSKFSNKFVRYANKKDTHFTLFFLKLMPRIPIN